MQKLTLKAAIIQSGKKCGDIADFMQVSTVTVSKWVNDYKGLDVKKLIKICQFIGIDVRDLDLESAANDND